MEIKYRAWDNYSKKMFNVKRLEFLPDGINVVLDDKDEGYSDGCELVQYTGRKDKHRVEIYNSDIIEITALTGAEGLAPGFVFHKLRVEIRWDNENALWSFNLDADWSEYYDKDSTREMTAFRNHVRTLMFDGETGKVIGNKYENPELLEDKH